MKCPRHVVAISRAWVSEALSNVPKWKNPTKKKRVAEEMAPHTHPFFDFFLVVVDYLSLDNDRLWRQSSIRSHRNCCEITVG